MQSHYEEIILEGREQWNLIHVFTFLSENSFKVTKVRIDNRIALSFVDLFFVYSESNVPSLPKILYPHYPCHTKKTIDMTLNHFENKKH